MLKEEKIIRFPTASEENFRMIDVGRKRPTRRRAVACGTITMSAGAFKAIQNGTLPKGNVLALAEAAGIMGAKKTPDMIPMCHTLPLDQMTIHCHLDDIQHSITVYAQAAAYAKTGVEMEALSGVSSALLTIWDLTKGVDPNLSIEGIKLLIKTGGKSGVWVNPEGIPDWLFEQLPDSKFLSERKAGVIVMSDRASTGTYQDQSGLLLVKLLESSGAEVTEYKVIPDDSQTISETLKTHCAEFHSDIVIASGGTGPGPRDVTPDVMEEICDKMLDGFGDLLRAESLNFTDTAWLSRMTAGMLGSTLVIAFPGSPKAVQECWDIISPFIGDALNKIKKQGYGA